ncbi:MAG: NADH-quinone oxidoreductase subunit H [Candidatus Omnitrophica bacterium]|nr:NADH-quinone oxidoreductase subunit H [Candidatus Omnitrophota bacterium]
MKFFVYMMEFIIFPGFLFTATVGLLASWVDRKVTARIQYRMGPPWYQGFADIVKLLGKETLLPSGASKHFFLFAPLLGLAGVTLVSSFLWIANIDGNKSFVGDIVVALYLLTLPAISLILAGFASNNPVASIGSSREIKLVLSYELPFILAIVVPIIKSGGSISINGILSNQAANGMTASSLSGFIALLVGILCMQAKLGLVPFDISEAETELTGGPIIDYSGAPLAVFKLTKAMLLFTVPVFLIVVFMGGIAVSGISILWSTLKYVMLLVIIILIRNTNPRLRIDQALRFFWGPVTGLAVVAVVLALFGL